VTLSNCANSRSSSPLLYLIFALVDTTEKSKGKQIGTESLLSSIFEVRAADGSICLFDFLAGLNVMCVPPWIFQPSTFTGASAGLKCDSLRSGSTQILRRGRGVHVCSCRIVDPVKRRAREGCATSSSKRVWKRAPSVQCWGLLGGCCGSAAAGCACCVVNGCAGVCDVSVCGGASRCGVLSLCSAGGCWVGAVAAQGLAAPVAWCTVLEVC
jgi:hypothetical protein